MLGFVYRGYPSGAILLWETDETVPLQSFANSQSANPYQSTRLLLDGQQRLTSLSAVIRVTPVSVRGRVRPIEQLFNLEHPNQLAVITKVDEGDDEDEGDDTQLVGDDADSDEDELLRRFNKMTFVVATRKLEQLPQWVKVPLDAELLVVAQYKRFLTERRSRIAAARNGFLGTHPAV